MAKDLAREIGYVYIDTGAMYRAVTLYALRNSFINSEGIDKESLQKQMGQIRINFVLDETTGRPLTHLNGECVEHEIRNMEVASHVSPIATLGFVREAMVEQQRQMGRDKGVILDGRDIGTVVFPDAELKIFVTASPEIRAQRRFDELTEKGVACNMQEILENVLERDRIDTTREISPLRQAEDAIVLDNSHMTIPEQKEWLLNEYKRAANED